jgi:hypothetical protein
MIPKALAFCEFSIFCHFFKITRADIGSVVKLVKLQSVHKCAFKIYSTFLALIGIWA